MIQIRNERPDDIYAIRMINDLAFGQPQEGEIVDRLRENCSGILSQVAVEDEQAVGHILFSPAVIEHSGKSTTGMGLAPMAVLPEYQRKGIGSMLVHAGIEVIRRAGHPFIVVLGHPEYYPRFGFERASAYGITSQWTVPDAAFMILILDGSAMAGVSGTARYREEFSAFI